MRNAMHMIRFVIFWTLFFVLPVRAASEFLYIPEIQGEANAPGFNGAISLTSFALLSGSEFEVVKLVDKASPALFLAVANGTSFPYVDILGYKNIGSESQPDLIFQFSNVFAASISTIANNGSSAEKVTFIYTNLASVPEPASYLLLMVGLGLFSTSAVIRQARSQVGSR